MKIKYGDIVIYKSQKVRVCGIGKSMMQICLPCFGKKIAFRRIWVDRQKLLFIKK